jgi:hypothetical protein
LPVALVAFRWSPSNPNSLVVHIGLMTVPPGLAI